MQVRLSLSDQNSMIADVFESLSYLPITLKIIQPADNFSELAGKDIQTQTFSFSDPLGNKFSLRTDLTGPTCRYYLDSVQGRPEDKKYSYQGPVFRFTDDTVEPKEFIQSGVERFGAPDGLIAEVDLIALALTALQKVGAQDIKVTISDFGLFSGLLDDECMPSRWRSRLWHSVRDADMFEKQLQSFGSDEIVRTSISKTIDDLVSESAGTKMKILEKLQSIQLDMQGVRTLDEIASRLLNKYDDRTEAALSRDVIDKIRNYLSFGCNADDVLTDLRSNGQGEAFSLALQQFQKRLVLIRRRGWDTKKFKFSAAHGRTFEYYTGFVFSIEVRGKEVVSGGRYDTMLKDLGAQNPIPAVGFAINTERLNMVLS
jgi:ATP phosphoribosyltransferase regulatory subunit